MRNKPRAVALLSGGLDGALAIRLLTAQGIEVVALNFTSPFITGGFREKNTHTASDVAHQLGVELKVLSVGGDFLEIVRRPRHGRGRGMNPCIDCRIYMLRHAAEIVKEIGADFVATGEVLGQRPMSQHLRAMKIIERESGLDGRLLRPLSAKLLEPTEPEKQGLVDRERLLSIQGRSRQEQLRLARREKIEVFSCAAGGCLLCDLAVAARIRDLFHYQQEVDMTDARLSTFGRHFRLNEKLKVILGRDQLENDRLVLQAPERPRAELVGPPGPTALICGQFAPADAPALARLVRAYCHKVRGEVPLKISFPGREETFPSSASATRDEIEAWRIESRQQKDD